MSPADGPSTLGWVGTVVAAPSERPGELVLALPERPDWPAESLAGRFVLVRCSQEFGPVREWDWGFYRRRALYVTGLAYQAEATWLRLWLPADEDPGHRWLGERPPGTRLHCLGPWGQGYRVDPTTRRLLLLADLEADPGGLARLMPLVDPALDRGARVTVLVRVAGRPALSRLPIPVEVRTASNADEWSAQLAETLAWADQVCGEMPFTAWGSLAETARRVRFRLEPGFCQVRVDADLVCGTGGCLACVVPRPQGGYTRACVHGPVFDLARWGTL